MKGNLFLKNSLKAKYKRWLKIFVMNYFTM